MNVDMLAPDELVFPRIGAPTRFAAIGAGLPAGAVMLFIQPRLRIPTQSCMGLWCSCLDSLMRPPSWEQASGYCFCEHECRSSCAVAENLLGQALLQLSCLLVRWLIHLLCSACPLLLVFCMHGLVQWLLSPSGCIWSSLVASFVHNSLLLGLVVQSAYPSLCSWHVPAFFCAVNMLPSTNYG